MTANDTSQPTESMGPGIQTRLSLLVVSATIVVMGLGGHWLVQEQAENMLTEEKQRSAALVESFALPCAIAVATNEMERLDGYLEEVVHSGGTQLGMIQVIMLDHEGHVVAHSGASGYSGLEATKNHRLTPNQDSQKFVEEATLSTKPLWRRYRTADSDPRLDISMPAVSGLRWGTLVASFDLRPFEARLKTTRTRLIVAAIVFTLTMLIALYYGLHRIVVRPLRALTLTAQDLEKGNLKARTNLDTGGELGVLAQQFNVMASELQAYTESLERKVEERSAEVRKKNRELEEVNSQLQAAVDKLEELARTDALTGISNRRLLMEVLVFELLRSERNPRPLSLLMIDVDHFKRVNDSCGHPVGDSVLKQAASLLSSHLRSTDLVARYGGEEFVVLLFDTPTSIGLEVGEKLRQKVSEAVFDDWSNDEHGPITISVGVAGFPGDARDAEHLILLADRALYRAKSNGRNQVVLWSEPPETPKPA